MARNRATSRCACRAPTVHDRLIAQKRANGRQVALGLFLVDDVPGSGKRDQRGSGERRPVLVGNARSDMVAL
jgi:hypothetical protein